MPHLNELQEQFGDRGLTVLGVTRESASKTEPWIEATGAEFAYAYDRSGDLARQVGLGGYPHAALVDPIGRIVWTGHPSSLSAEVVESHLAGALPIPMWEFPESWGKAKSALQKRKFAKALQEAERLGEDGAVLHSAIAGMVEGRVLALESMVADGDILGFQSTLKTSLKELAGLPQVDALKALDKRVDRDETAKVQLADQKRVERLGEQKIKKASKDKILDELRDILGQHGDTAPGREAKALIERIEGRR